MVMAKWIKDTNQLLRRGMVIMMAMTMVKMLMDKLTGTNNMNFPTQSCLNCLLPAYLCVMSVLLIPCKAITMLVIMNMASRLIKMKSMTCTITKFRDLFTLQCHKNRMICKREAFPGFRLMLIALRCMLKLLRRPIKLATYHLKKRKFPYTGLNMDIKPKVLMINMR